ncbi:MAG: Rieske 2Fe-2S domain-containing protein [Nitrospirota bacterium]
MTENFSDSRRKFLGYAIVGMSGAVALGYAIPLVQYIVKPALKPQEAQWSLVCGVQNIKTDAPKSFTFFSNLKIAWQTERVQRDVWVVKKPDGSYNVFSPVCPHLGCAYNWNGNIKHFVCPCHGSVYDINGKVLAGPAPRPLDTLPAKIDNGNLYVKYEKFILGIPEKVLA